MMASSSYGEVYVNMQWDEAMATFRVMPLNLEGESLTLDRFYQNAYGDINHLDPGPPFIFEEAVNILSIRDSNGDVVKDGWSSLTIRNDQLDLSNPFTLVFAGNTYDVYGENSIYIDGSLTVEGIALDEVKIEGAYRMRSNGDQFNVTGTENSYDITFKHVDFSGTTSTSIPMEFKGGHVSFEDCLIKNLSGYPEAILASFRNDLTFEPQWSYTMRGCNILNNATQSDRVIWVQHAAKTIIEDNYCANNDFGSYLYPSIVELDRCGITRIDDNTVGTNRVNAFRINTCFADTTSYIQTSSDLPLLVTLLRVDPDRELTIDEESVLKFYSYEGGLKNQGTLSVTGSVLTSSADDAIGGDSDGEPQPASISPWYHLINGSIAGGVTCDSMATIYLKDTRIRYAKIGTQLRGTSIIEGCTYEDCTSCGVHLYPRGNQDFIVRNTTIQRTKTDGQANLEAALRIDDLTGSQTDILIDSVTIANNSMRGVWLSSSGNSAPFNMILRSSRIVGNTSLGVNLVLNNPSANIQISSSVLAANFAWGLCVTGSTGGPEIGVYNSVIAGNGYGPSANRDGLYISTGSLDFIGNSVIRNYGLGLYVFNLTAPADSRITNNIFARNGSRGLFQSTSVPPILAYNDFWSNAVSELYFNTGTAEVTTVEELQATGGEYATNMHVDPGFRPELLGTIVAVAYDSLLVRSTLVASSGSVTGWTYDTALVCPDTLDPLWFMVTKRNGDTLSVLGDIRAKAQAGDVFRLLDYHLASGSLLIDTGGGTYANGLYDFEGNQRQIDGDEGGGVRVDIGAHEFNPDSLAIVVTRPEAGVIFRPGDTCHIEWTCRYSDRVNLMSSVHPDSALVEIALNQSASPGEYDWVVPDSVFSGLCQILIASDSGAYGESGAFGIKGSILARRTPTGDFEAFAVNEDGWQFGNDSAHLWPESYFSTIDYVNGVDPNTGLKYPSVFTSHTVCNAKAQDFPDWQTWVRAFGVDQCYIQTPIGRMYNSSALARWTAVKDTSWSGSCFGLAILSQLGFDNPAECVTVFPELGIFTNLHDLTINNGRRDAINMTWTKQFGAASQEHMDRSIYILPRITVQRCREMLDTLSWSQITAAISFCDWPSGGGGGCHTVTPVRVVKDPVHPSVWLIEVYDNNFPDSTGLAIEVDTAANVWQYRPFSWVNTHHLFVEDPIEHYKQPTVMAASGRTPRLAAADDDLQSVFVQSAGTAIFNSALGAIGKAGDSIVADSGAGRTIVPRSGPGAPVIGFRMPPGDWTASFGALNDSTLRLMIDGGRVLTHLVLDVAADSLIGTFRWVATDHNLGIGNGGTDLWQAALRQIQVFPDSQVVFDLSDLSINTGDSLTLNAVNGVGARVSNWGATDTCFFSMTVASTSRSIEFVDSILEMAGMTAYTFAPDNADLLNNQLRVYVDAGIDGSIDDTILLNNNVLTDVDEQGSNDQLPYRFELAQNYPNPFNPVTTIEYSLPERAQVTIEVFNVLGQRVRTLVNDTKSAGSYRIEWNGNDETGKAVSTGVYLYRFSAGDIVQTKKMLLVK
jgi:hypothetical protein